MGTKFIDSLRIVGKKHNTNDISINTFFQTQNENDHSFHPVLYENFILRYTVD